MTFQLWMSLLVVAMPAYEGYMVYALQHVTKALAEANLTSAHQLVATVPHSEAQIEEKGLLDPCYADDVDLGTSRNTYSRDPVRSSLAHSHLPIPSLALQVTS